MTAALPRRQVQRHRRREIRQRDLAATLVSDEASLMRPGASGLLGRDSTSKCLCASLHSKRVRQPRALCPAGSPARRCRTCKNLIVHSDILGLRRADRTSGALRIESSSSVSPASLDGAVHDFSAEKGLSFIPEFLRRASVSGASCLHGEKPRKVRLENHHPRRTLANGMVDGAALFLKIR